MRPSQKSGRGRGKGNRGKSQGHSPNRVYESAGPEGKVRGTPQQIIDKYLALARDCQLSGDRVTAENFLQHAEHYTRILTAAQEAQAERQAQHEAQQQQNRGGGDQNRDQNRDNDRGQNDSQNGAGRGDRAANGSDEDQPSSDGLGAIDAADGSEANIVDTPEEKAAKPRQRRPRKQPQKTEDEAAASEAG